METGGKFSKYIVVYLTPQKSTLSHPRYLENLVSFKSEVSVMFMDFIPVTKQILAQ